MNMDSCNVFAEIDGIKETLFLFNKYPDILYVINDKSSVVREIFRKAREENDFAINKEIYDFVEKNIEIKNVPINYFTGDIIIDYVLDVLMSCYIDCTNDAHFFKRFDTYNTIFYAYKEIKQPENIKGKFYVHSKREFSPSL